MHQVKQGDTVQVRYTAKLPDGQVFSPSGGPEGVEFTVGSGQVIEGLENAVVGMRPGESKVARIPPDQAFGPRQPGRVLAFSREQFPDDIDAKPGLPLTVQYNDGSQRPGVIASVTDDAVVVDANHPLAGKDLTVDLTLVGVVAEEE